MHLSNYKSRAVYLSHVGFFNKMSMVSGFSVQVSENPLLGSKFLGAQHFA
jgi:hypothetical protein